MTTTTTPAGPEGQIKLPNGKISIPVTSVVPPARLVIDGVHFTPGVVTSRRAPVSVRVHVADSRGFWVRGALVFARTTPLVTSTPPEQITNQSGYVTLTMSPRATFPLKPGYHVAVLPAHAQGRRLAARRRLQPTPRSGRYLAVAT